jgi:hypothetical protein
MDMGLKDISSLHDFNQGVVQEQFNREWPKILKNIADPATEPKTKRKLTIEVEITPSEDRSSAKVLVKAKSSLAPVKSDESVIFMELTNGGVVAMAKEAEKQLPLENVIPMGKGKEA